MSKLLLIFFAAVLFMPACQRQGDEKPPKTQLEIRQFQTRNFDTKDVRLVMKSLLNVLQDDGYVVKNVALDLGFISANKEEDVEDGSERFFARATRGGQARWVKNELIEATLNVTEFGDTTRVRTNFQRKVFDNQGVVVTIQQITDEQFYQEFFTKVDKGIFIQGQDI